MWPAKLANGRRGIGGYVSLAASRCVHRWRVFDRRAAGRPSTRIGLRGRRGGAAGRRATTIRDMMGCAG
jgi:hypothetical protein